MSAPFSTSSWTIAQVAVLGGVHQRILVALDREIHVGAAIDQHLHLIEPAVGRGRISGLPSPSTTPFGSAP